MIVAHLIGGPGVVDGLDIERAAAYWTPEGWVAVLVIDGRDHAGAHVWYDDEPDERELDAGEGMSWHVYKLDTTRREEGVMHAYYQHYHRR